MSDPIVGKLKEWKNHPLIFVSEALGVKHISDQQADGLVKFAKTKKMSIRSGHGTGKTVFAAWCILWFLTTRAYSKVMCTAPTGRQLSDYLWSTISKWLRQSLIADEFIIQKDKVYHISSPKEWWARAISASVKATKEEQAETLSGIHDEHLLIVVDESAGVHDPVFIPIEGALTREDNKVLLIGNMTQNKDISTIHTFIVLSNNHGQDCTGIVESLLLSNQNIQNIWQLNMVLTPIYLG